MSVAGWLDEKEAEGFDVSQIALPNDLTYDEAPEETIYFRGDSSVQHPLHRQSPLFDCRTFWTLVLQQRSGQESRHSFVRNGMEAVYEG